MDNTKPKNSVKTIQSVNRSLDIIEIVHHSEEPLSLTEICTALSLNKTTVFHLIKTLEVRGYIHCDPKTNRYRLGLKLFQLGQSVEEYTNLITGVALPYMRKMRDKYNETLHFGIWQRHGDNFTATYIEKIETTSPMRLVSRVGQSVPLHCTALGKMFLAQLSFEEVERALGTGELPQFTPTTFTKLEELRHELDVSRERGWFFDNIEYEPGVTCIAVPVFNRSRKAVAGISITIPAERLTADRKPNIIADMLELSRTLSEEISG